MRLKFWKNQAKRSTVWFRQKAAKISAFSSNNLDKYEYLAGEELDYKRDAVEEVRFEYSPLGKIVTKGLEEKENKEGILKRQKKYWS